jgi:hypothetical protein
MVHTAVVLPRHLLEQLRKDAAASNKGLSTEIRQILKVHYMLQALPKEFETRNLLDAIWRLAEFLAKDLGKKWHEDPYVLAAFKAGVASFLVRYHPEGDEKVRPGASAGEPNDPPDVVGRTHARRIRIGDHIDDDDNEPPFDEDHHRDMRDIP